MRYFIVTVHPKRVQIDEQEKVTRTTEFKAVVDGDEVLYEVKRHHNTSRIGQHWRARGRQAIYNHAKNLGEVVRFEFVYHQKRNTTKKQENQLSFW